MGIVIGLLTLIGAIGGVKYLWDSHKQGNSIIPDNVSSKAKDVLPDIRWD